MRLPRLPQKVTLVLAAVFVVLHIVSSCVDVVPNLGQALDRRTWREPRVRHELDLWAARLGMERAPFEDRLYKLTRSIQGTRALVETPLRPWLDVTGNKQSWAMFIAGTRDRDRFQVRARTCTPSDPSPTEVERCPWIALYTRGVDEEDFLRDILEHPRVRSATFRWGWPAKKKAFQRGCAAIARRVFEAKPDVVDVQCRWERSASPGPHDDGPLPPPRWDREVTIAKATLPPIEAIPDDGDDPKEVP